MIWYVYNALFVVVFVLLLPRFFWRMWKRGGYRRHFLQRIGHYDAKTLSALASDTTRIWVHAVSVGELFVAFRFIDELRRIHPEWAFVLSTTTSTGHAIARERVKAPDVLLYFPVDIPLVMNRVLRLVRPRACVIVETEIWPNLIRSCHRQGIPVALINGRLSARSFRGYRNVSLFTRRLFPLIDVLCMQSEADADRMRLLGAPPDRTHVVGSAKYELVEREPEREAAAKEALRAAGFEAADPVLLGGSTWAGEEAALFRIYRALKVRWPRLRLVVAPRHVERTPDVVEELARQSLQGVRLSRLRSGDAPSGDEGPDVLLVDTTGELRHFYAHADVIFVGKSLTFHGGQNVIEPAVYAKPVIVGPHMENFAFIIADFLKSDALRQVQSEEELGEVMKSLLESERLREELGARAADFVRSRAGAMDKSLHHVLPLLS